MTIPEIARKMETNETVLFHKEDSYNDYTSIITVLLYDKGCNKYFVEDDEGRQYYLCDVHEINKKNLGNLNIRIEGVFKESHLAIVGLIRDSLQKQNVFYTNIESEVIDD